MFNKSSFKNLVLLMSLMLIISCSGKKKPAAENPADPGVTPPTINAPNASDTQSNSQTTEQKPKPEINFGHIEITIGKGQFTEIAALPVYVSPTGTRKELQSISKFNDRFETDEAFSSFVEEYLSFSNNIIERTKGKLIPNLFWGTKASIHLNNTQDGEILSTFSKFENFEDLVQVINKYLDYRDQFESMNPGLFSFALEYDHTLDKQVTRLHVQVGNKIANKVLIFYGKTGNEAIDILQSYIEFAESTLRRTEGRFIPSLYEFNDANGFSMNIKRIINPDEDLEIITNVDIANTTNLGFRELIEVGEAYIDLMEKFNFKFAPSIHFKDSFGKEISADVYLYKIISDKDEQEFITNFEVFNINDVQEFLSKIESELVKISQEK